MTLPYLPINDMAERHQGLTPEIAACYLQAARVCLDRHHAFIASSLAEQRRIIAELDAIQAKVKMLKQLQSEIATEIDALLPSILDRAFKGNL